MQTRTMHLIDLENMAGEGLNHAQALACVGQHLRAFWRCGDIVTIASCKKLFCEVSFELRFLPHVFKIVTSTPDAADHELLRSAREIDTAAFANLAIASGDGIFADLAADAAQLGHTVSVSARPGSLSRRLRSVSHATLMLDTADFGSTIDLTASTWTTAQLIPARG